MNIPWESYPHEMPFPATVDLVLKQGLKGEF